LRPWLCPSALAHSSPRACPVSHAFMPVIDVGRCCEGRVIAIRCGCGTCLTERYGVDTSRTAAVGARCAATPDEPASRPLSSSRLRHTKGAFATALLSCLPCLLSWSPLTRRASELDWLVDDAATGTEPRLAPARQIQQDKMGLPIPSPWTKAVRQALTAWPHQWRNAMMMMMMMMITREKDRKRKERKGKERKGSLSCVALM